MNHTLFLFVLLIGLNPLFAQENTGQIKLLISARVDTSSKEVKSVIKLCENYYNSNPDSIYNNPYWNTAEKKLYKDFDFSRSSMFPDGMTAKRLFQYYPPFVMSVEPLGAKYQIRVLISSPTSEPKYAGSKVWCIQKLTAVKENGVWKFENLMVEITKKWQSKKVGWIEYVYPPNHSFDHAEAERAKTFCSGIIHRFNPGYKDSFTFYVTSSTDDMGLLENFDYYFVGITTGKTREGMILTAKGNENYPHEFVHKLLPPNPKRGFIIDEGLATFLGTIENQEEYEVVMNKLATDLNKNPEQVNFKSVLSQKIVFNGYQIAYPAGAGICELVHEAGGDKGLIQLLKADTETYDEIIKAVCSITNLTEQELEDSWTKTMKKYLKN